MSETALNWSPPLGAVVREQLRTVGLAIRREALGAGAFVVLPTLAVFVIVMIPALQQAVWPGSPPSDGLDLDPAGGWGVIAAVLAVCAPLAVWKGERTFGDAELWALPVDHQRHALIKLGVGWVWLLAFTVAAFAWLMLLAWMSGGALGVEGTRLVITDYAAARTGAPGGTMHVPWSTPWWQWMVPFSSVTAAYLLGSALLLGTARPGRWLAGGILVLLVGAMLSGAVPALRNTLERAWWEVTYGPRGLDVLTSGGLEGLTTILELPSGERAVAWRDLPSFRNWVEATALWTTLGAVSLWAALRRHRER